MMTLTLTPEQERRLIAYAKQRRKPVTAALDELLPDIQSDAPETATEEPQTWGAKKLAELEAIGALGVFQDRPEDSITLARKFQALAEGHDGEGDLDR